MWPEKIENTVFFDDLRHHQTNVELAAVHDDAKGSVSLNAIYRPTEMPKFVVSATPKGDVRHEFTFLSLDEAIESYNVELSQCALVFA
jgi:hypothetical protein